MAPLLAALALTGCETSAEESAKLEKSAKRVVLASHGLSITRPSAFVRVLSAVVIHDSEGAAVAVTVRNRSAHALRSVPIAITVADAHGRTLFKNNAPGLETALTSISLLPARSELTWVDDQIPASAGPAAVSAIVGEAAPARAPTPPIEIEKLQPSEEAGGGAAGTVRNRSTVAQRKLVVYVLARAAGRLVAVGRALLPELGAGASAPFQAFLVGASAGARLQASAPPSTLG